MTEVELYTVYKGVYMPTLLHPPESLKFYEEFCFRPDDVLIVTYPKSGTTWMQDVAPLIQSGGDLVPIETVPNWDRVPWLEEHRAHQLNLEQRPSPRLFATHFHYDMMPPSYFSVKPKVIYVMRNPKDVFTSSFHYYGMASFLVNPGTQSDFLHKFLEGKVMFGSWFDHIRGWLGTREKERILYISYEEMIADLTASITKMAQFMDKALHPEVVEKIAESCVFHNMKRNKMSNYSTVPTEFMDQSKSSFFRKGISGDWKNQLTVSESEYFDSVYKDKMKDVKYNFAWD